MQEHAKRSANHSIDRFLLAAALRRFYKGFLVFSGRQDELRRLAADWTEEERERWDTDRVLTALFLARVMNVRLGGDSAGELWLESDARLEELRALMLLQYESEAECEALRAQRAADPRAEAGVQRKTVANLLGELLTFERRLAAMPDQALADDAAARTQGFRLRACCPGEAGARKMLFCVVPVGRSEHDMAAVQAAQYPFLDRRATQIVLDGLMLSAPRRQAMDETAEEKETPPAPAALTETLERALAAVGEMQEAALAQTEGEPFWYEITYHAWRWENGALCLAPRAEPVPMLPWQVVYSNGYFYLSGLRLDLDPAVTGGKGGEPVLSNLRLDRAGEIRRVGARDGMLDRYSLRDLRRLCEALGGMSGGAIAYRNASTIMYSGAPEPLVIDCDAALMNSAVDDFGLDNLEWAGELSGGRVRVRVKSAVWQGAKQWLLQHAGACRLADVPGQEHKRAEMARALGEAARQYGSAGE